MSRAVSANTGRQALTRPHATLLRRVGARLVAGGVEMAKADMTVAPVEAVLGLSMMLAAVGGA